MPKTLNDIINTAKKSLPTPDANKQLLVQLMSNLAANSSAAKFTSDDGEDMSTELINKMSVGDIVDTDIGLLLLNSKTTSDADFIKLNIGTEDANIQLVHYYLNDDDEWTFDEYYTYEIGSGVELYNLAFAKQYSGQTYYFNFTTTFSSRPTNDEELREAIKHAVNAYKNSNVYSIPLIVTAGSGALSSVRTFDNVLSNEVYIANNFQSFNVNNILSFYKI